MARTKKKLSYKAYYNRWYSFLLNSACANFEWENLPEEINYIALNRTLLEQGYAIFFKDKALDKYFATTGAMSGVDVYGYPTQFKPISLNTSVQFPMYSNEDAVPIYITWNRTTPREWLMYYADELTNIQHAIDMHVLMAKKPLWLKTSNATQQSVDAILNKYEDSFYAVITSNQYKLDDIFEKVDLGFNTQDLINLQKEKETILNEFYNLFGIASVTEKRERLVVGEIKASEGQSDNARYMWLEPLQYACDKINEIYNLDLKVKFREVKTEVEEDGSIYNDTTNTNRDNLSREEQDK